MKCDKTNKAITSLLITASLFTAIIGSTAVLADDVNPASLQSSDIIGIWNPSDSDGEMALKEDGSGHFHEGIWDYDVSWSYAEEDNKLTIVYPGDASAGFDVNQTSEGGMEAVSEDKSLTLVKNLSAMIPSDEEESDSVNLSETESETVLANIREVSFSLDKEQEYYDVSYKYPEEFELEINEDEPDRVRHVLRYHVEGFDPTAVGIVVSRTDAYTPEERLKDIAFIDEVTTEEIDGIPWAIGTQTDISNGRVIIYSCAANGYTYTFSFSTDYPEDFDFTDFAKAFAREVTMTS